MMILLNLVVFVLMLGLIIAIHELGHLIFAKRAGILCYEYSLGFGPKLYNKKEGETEFSIRAIPLGGFVSMAGELNSELIKKEQVIGLNLKDGKITEIILTDKVKAELTIKVTNFEVYDEQETGYLFIEGLVGEDLKHFEIDLTAQYIISEKQKLQISPYNRSFESKSYMEKFLTLLAGPMMNFILAIFLFLIVAAFTGKPQNTNVIGEVSLGLPASVGEIKTGDKILSIGGYPVNNWTDINDAYNNLNSFTNVNIEVLRDDVATVKTVDLAIDAIQLGIRNYNKDGVLLNTSINKGAIVGSTYANAQKILKEGDIIQTVKYKNNPSINIENWHDLIEVVKTLNGDYLEITFLRDSETITKSIMVWEHKVLNSQKAKAYNIMLGISPERKFSLTYLLTQPFVSAYDSFYQVVSIIGLLFGNSKQIGVSDLSGPVGIFDITGKIMRQGFLALLSFTAFLSVNVGVMNLLPIPALDGGRILFISIEGVTKKKIPKNIDNLINNIFFFLLMGLFIFVTINDIFKMP